MYQKTLHCIWVIHFPSSNDQIFFSLPKALISVYNLTNIKCWVCQFQQIFYTILHQIHYHFSHCSTFLMLKAYLQRKTSPRWSWILNTDWQFSFSHLLSLKVQNELTWKKKENLILGNLTIFLTCVKGLHSSPTFGTQGLCTFPCWFHPYVLENLQSSGLSSIGSDPDQISFFKCNAHFNFTPLDI